MKSYIMLTLFTLISLTTTLNAQNGKTKLNESFNLELESFSKKFSFDVEGTHRLQMEVKSKIKDGTLEVNIYTPDGKKEHCFTLEADIGISGAKGEMNQDADDPFNGQWIVEVISNKALGDLKINIKQ